MEIICSKQFLGCYAPDAASAPGRIETILETLSGFHMIEPDPASENDILLAHAFDYVHTSKWKRSYPMALLSAGGAILASKLAWEGRTAFALIRPPGHHASSDHAWGFCTFNNMAVAMLKLQSQHRIKTGTILDFDLHFGDGSDSILKARNGFLYFHPEHPKRRRYLEAIENFLAHNYGDILGVSAGFDRAQYDWGAELTDEDYFTIGALIKRYSRRFYGRIFIILEGGYCQHTLGRTVRAFINGVEGGIF